MFSIVLGKFVNQYGNQVGDHKNNRKSPFNFLKRRFIKDRHVRDVGI